MNMVVGRIRLWISADEGDRACIELCVELVEEDDDGMPFGRILKARAARALCRAFKRGEIDAYQQQRLRTRILDMLRRGLAPREYQQYSKLLRDIGFAADDLDALHPFQNGNTYVKRYHRYFRSILAVNQRTEE